VKLCPINKLSIDLKIHNFITLALKLISAEIDMFVWLYNLTQSNTVTSKW